MSWLKLLYETYENCIDKEDSSEKFLLPICHTSQQIHLEITININGEFISANVLTPREDTVIQATEDSASRSGTKPPPHPLADKIQYCAKDYPAFGGEKPSFFTEYEKQLEAWCSSPYSNEKVLAVYKYIQKGKLVEDLIKQKILFIEDSILLTIWDKDEPEPEIFKQLIAKDGEKDQGDLLVRWIVFKEGDNNTNTWQDKEVQESWIKFDLNQKEEKNICLISGEIKTVSTKHPAKIRHSGDKAKIISSNDKENYTFLGRFSNAQQACTISFDATQKAHNALRWLIEKQGYKKGTLVFIAWETTGKEIPRIEANLYEDFGMLYEKVVKKINNDEFDEEAIEKKYIDDDTIDIAEDYAKRLRAKMYGYKKDISDTNKVVMLGLDSTGGSTGRIAIVFNRQLKGTDFLNRLEKWHTDAAWYQRYYSQKEKRWETAISAPLPKDMIEAAYGKRVQEKFHDALIQKILACIIDGRNISNNLVENAIKRICNKQSMDFYEWEKNLAVTCALIKKQIIEKGGECSMGLDENIKTREYLFGRLLALWEYTEERALYLLGENRETNVKRYFNHFVKRPIETTLIIKKKLIPYQKILKNKRPALAHKQEKLITQVFSMITQEDFSDAKGKLNGEFLLGYYCQKDVLNNKSNENSDADKDNNTDEKNVEIG